MDVGPLVKIDSDHFWSEFFYAQFFSSIVEIDMWEAS